MFKEFYRKMILSFLTWIIFWAVINYFFIHASGNMELHFRTLAMAVVFTIFMPLSDSTIKIIKNRFFRNNSLQ